MNIDANPLGAAIDTLAAELRQGGRLRVWSLIVTLFGDAILPRGGRAPLSLVQDAMALIGVESGAVRTALSRLAADGWVTREREGRNSFYRLAEGGRHAFDEATRRIYAGGPPAWDGLWTIAVSLPAEGSRHVDSPGRMEAMGFVAVAPTAWIRPETTATPSPEDIPSDILWLSGRPATGGGDMAALWPIAEVAEGYLRLIERFEALDAALHRRAGLDPAHAFAARLLLIHHWRRVVLKDPCLPIELVPKAWPGEAARALVSRIYGCLAPASEAWLDSAGMPPLVNATRFAARFAAGQSSR